MLKIPNGFNEALFKQQYPGVSFSVDVQGNLSCPSRTLCDADLAACVSLDDVKSSILARIDSTIAKHDMDTIRSARAIAAGSATQSDHDKLAAIENSVVSLRVARTNVLSATTVNQVIAVIWSA